MVESLTTLLLGAVVFCTLPTALVAALSHHHRNVWGPTVERVVQPARDDYRSGPVVVVEAAKAPRAVLVASWTSIAMGQMFVPGLIAGLYGLLAMGIGLVSIPGLIVAARCFWSGVSLLNGTDRAAEFARKTASWSAALNMLIVGMCVLAMIFGSALRWSNDVLALSLLTLLYACLSLGHAWLLRHAADLVESARSVRTEAELVTA